MTEADARRRNTARIAQAERARAVKWLREKQAEFESYNDRDEDLVAYGFEKAADGIEVGEHDRP